MAEPTLRKPVGGLEAVALTPAGNLLRAVAGADGRITVTLRDDEQLIALPLLEERSSCDEQLDTEAGVQRVRHTLTLVTTRETARARLTPTLCRTAATEGMLALVTTAPGQRLLVGWSARLGTEHPLRLSAIHNGSGTRPLDGTPVTITFTSEDADPAAEIKNPES